MDMYMHMKHTIPYRMQAKKITIFIAFAVEGVIYMCIKIHYEKS